jgi:uncharacterized protein YodC (DUF2158 family)
MHFEPGVVVQLKSGGPTMTVVAMEAAGVQCIWYAEATDEVRSALIPAVALDIVELAVAEDEDESDDD